VELLDARGVRPAVAWSTIARAERLAHLGVGWSADHVLRLALHALERERLEGHQS
jgi:hypothetical protein